MICLFFSYNRSEAIRYALSLDVLWFLILVCSIYNKIILELHIPGICTLYAVHLYYGITQFLECLDCDLDVFQYEIFIFGLKFPDIFYVLFR